MQKVYISDLDGTLYDRKKLKQRIIFSYLGKGFWRSLVLMGSERSARKELRLQNTGTMGYSEFFALVAKKSGQSPEYVRDWYNNSYMVHMAQVLEKHYCARPGIVDKIKALKKEGFEDRSFPLRVPFGFPVSGRLQTFRISFPDSLSDSGLRAFGGRYDRRPSGSGRRQCEGGDALYRHY